MDKCKFCGAEAYLKDEIGNVYFECGSRCNDVEFIRRHGCYERQLAQSEARARELWDALDTLLEMKWAMTDADNREAAEAVRDKHADSFRKRNP
jgi:hypothetical protein